MNCLGENEPGLYGVVVRDVGRTVIPGQGFEQGGRAARMENVVELVGGGGFVAVIRGFAVRVGCRSARVAHGAEQRCENVVRRVRIEIRREEYRV